MTENQRRDLYPNKEEQTGPFRVSDEVWHKEEEDLVPSGLSEPILRPHFVCDFCKKMKYGHGLILLVDEEYYNTDCMFICKQCGSSMRFLAKE